MHRHRWSEWSGPWDIWPFSTDLFKIRRCAFCSRKQVARVRNKMAKKTRTPEVKLQSGEFVLPASQVKSLGDNVSNDTNSVLRDLSDGMVVYVSGPMTGYPEHNYPAFHEAATKLRSEGFEVVNPAENFDGRMDLEPATYLRRDFSQMANECNSIYLLEGWQNSTGARAEFAVARALGFQFLKSPGWNGIEEPVEYEASRIVRNGERQKNYGHPNADFQRTAGMWTAFLAHKLKPGEEITMQEMALMMGQLKMSRLASSPQHHDSLVDLIGYAICADRLNE